MTFQSRTGERLGRLSLRVLREERKMSMMEDTSHRLKPRTNLTDGRAMVDMVRLGMTMGKETLREAARAVGMGDQTYQFIRKMILLKSRQVLDEGETATINRVIDDLTYRLSIQDAMKIAKPIIDRHWHAKTKTGVPQTKNERMRQSSNLAKRKRADGRLRRRFDGTLFAIRESCGNNDELVIPTLTDEERDEACRQMFENIENLFSLYVKIRKGKGQ